MTKQLSARECAEYLERASSEFWWCHQAAAHLRRLESENAEIRARLEAAEKQKPVAWLFQHEDTGLTEIVDAQQVEWGFEKNNPRWQKIHPVYAAPITAEPVADERGAFEAWALDPDGGNWLHDSFMRDGDGYEVPRMDDEWQAFKAGAQWQARAKLNLKRKNGVFLSDIDLDVALAEIKSDGAEHAPCSGLNCGCTDGQSHSNECHAEHAAAIAGGHFIKQHEGDNLLFDFYQVTSYSALIDAQSAHIVRLQEAAKVCERIAMCHGAAKYTGSSELMTAIRALIDKPAAMQSKDGAA